MIQIYHNSRCGKSRECLIFLQNSGNEFEIINYTKEILTFDELKIIIKKLDIKPMALVRKKEKIWIENFKNKDFNNDEIIKILIENPILIERPLVINGNQAIIARPLENIKKII